MTNTVAGIHLGPDDHASRPAAGDVTAGTIYSCTDHDLIYISDGSSWTTWATLGSGTSLPNLFVGTVDPQLASEDTMGPVSANRSVLYKYLCNADVTVDTVKFRVGTQAGNLDFGIYSADLATLHASTGSFACPAAGQASQALGSSFAMVGGTIYYLAVAMSNTSVRLISETNTTNYVATGWNMWGHADSNMPLAAGPTPTWEAFQGKAAFYFEPV